MSKVILAGLLVVLIAGYAGPADARGGMGLAEYVETIIGFIERAQNDVTGLTAINNNGAAAVIAAGQPGDKWAEAIGHLADMAAIDREARALYVCDELQPAHAAFLAMTGALSEMAYHYNCALVYAGNGDPAAAARELELSGDAATDYLAASEWFMTVLEPLMSGASL